MNNNWHVSWIMLRNGQKICYMDLNGKRLGVRVLNKDMEATAPEFLRILNAMMDIANKEA